MSLKRVAVFPYLGIILLLIALFPEQAKAERDLMAAAYPKFRLYGLIDLEFLDYSTSAIQSGIGSQSNTTTQFQQRYTLGALGYVTTPKLLVYSAEVSFFDSITKFRNDGEDFKDNEKQIWYDVHASFLRERPVSLDVYAMRSSGTVSDGTSQDISGNSYGATLRLLTKDFTFLKKKTPEGGGGLVDALPSVRLSYNHWDYTFGTSGKNTIDTFEADMGGYIKRIRTQYSLVYQLTDYSVPGSSQSTTYVAANTHTFIGARNSFDTLFQHSSSPLVTSTVLNLNLSLIPNERFSHNYSYDYSGLEVATSKSTFQEIQGTWDYLFTKRFSSRANAYYYLSTTDQQNTDAYGTSVTMNYRRPLKGFDFASTYSFSYNTSNQFGNFIENSLNLDVRTRTLKWGTIYGDYTFTNLTTPQGSLTDNMLRAGVRGNGPGRLYWTFEAEYNNVTNALGGLSAVLPGGSQYLFISGASHKTSYYSLTPELNYPLGWRGLVTLSTSYSSGTADSQPFTRYYYDVRATYLLLRNLSLLAWWRDGWDKVNFSGTDQRSWIFTGNLYYRLRRLFLSLEYVQWNTTDVLVSSTTKGHRLFLKLTRPI